MKAPVSASFLKSSLLKQLILDLKRIVSYKTNASREAPASTSDGYST